MGKINDLTGKKFGRLVVVSFSKIQSKKSYWFCKCDCGKEAIVQGSNLTTGHSLSCGCFSSQETKTRSTRHKATKEIQLQGLTVKEAAIKANCSLGHLQGVLSKQKKSRITYYGISQLIPTSVEQICEREEFANRSKSKKQLVKCSCCGMPVSRFPYQIKRSQLHFVNIQHRLDWQRGKRPTKSAEGVLWDAPKPPKERRRDPLKIAISEVVKEAATK